MEEGEQTSACFFRLENNILKITLFISDNSKLISNFGCNFYSNSYSSKHNEEATPLFLKSVKDLKSIDITDKNH